MRNFSIPGDFFKKLKNLNIWEYGKKHTFHVYGTMRYPITLVTRLLIDFFPIEYSNDLCQW